MSSRSAKAETMRDRCGKIRAEEEQLREGGGKAGQERQHKLGRLVARERIARLLDTDAQFFEIGLWAAYKMYEQWGRVPAAGAVAGISNVANVPCMIVANDATVKAGAFFPQTVKKLIRAQRIAFENYLPVLCDKILMTEGSGLYLAGPSLVKAAIGQIVDQEELGGAKMHSEISGTVDFFEKNDEACLEKLRSLVALLPEANEKCAMPGVKNAAKPGDAIYELISLDGHKNYDVRDLLATIIDADSLDEYKADYGKTLVTAYARIGGRAVGIVASQRLQVRTKTEGIQMGGVIYSDSADKAARFVMDCNQVGLPILFFQDVTGFMVGKAAEQSGIIRSGAKLVNAVSNSIVPKITIVVGGSFGAGNYALCGKAYGPRFILAWPNARYAVMGAAQASDTVFSILARAKERGDKKAAPEELEELRAKVKASYEEQTDIRYGAARGWIDAIIQPHETRDVLIRLLSYVSRPPAKGRFHTGVIQV